MLIFFRMCRFIDAGLLQCCPLTVGLSQVGYRRTLVTLVLVAACALSLILNRGAVGPSIII